MPFDFLDGIELIDDLLNFFGSISDSKFFGEKSNSKKKSKYSVEWWSGSLLLFSAILFFFVFKDPLPTENFIWTVIVCLIIGLVISFVVFCVLYYLELYYFKSLFKLLLLSCSVILFSVSIILLIYFKSGIFI